MISFMISVVPPKIDYPHMARRRSLLDAILFDSYDAPSGPSGIISCANASE